MLENLPSFKTLTLRSQSLIFKNGIGTPIIINCFYYQIVFTRRSVKRGVKLEIIYEALLYPKCEYLTKQLVGSYVT